MIQVIDNYFKPNDLRYMLDLCDQLKLKPYSTNRGLYAFGNKSLPAKVKEINNRYLKQRFNFPTSKYSNYNEVIYLRKPECVLYKEIHKDNGETRSIKGFVKPKWNLLVFLKGDFNTANGTGFFELNKDKEFVLDRSIGFKKNRAILFRSKLWHGSLQPIEKNFSSWRYTFNSFISK